MCLFLNKLQWILSSLDMSSSLYVVQKAAMCYIILTGMKYSAIALCRSHQIDSVEDRIAGL